MKSQINISQSILLKRTTILIIVIHIVHIDIYLEFMISGFNLDFQQKLCNGV